MDIKARLCMSYDCQTICKDLNKLIIENPQIRSVITKYPTGLRASGVQAP